MADVTFALMTDSLLKKFAARVTNQIERSVVLPQLIPALPSTGQIIQWDVRFGTDTGAVIADGADVATFNNDDKIPAVLQYGTYNDAFAITGKALAAARVAGSPEQLMNLFLDELDNSVERLAKRISLDIWTGSGVVDTIHGLLATAGGLLDTGTYAGIDRAVRTQWQGNVLANGAIPRPLTLDLMREMRRTVYTASGLKPDLIVCDPIQHENYGKLLQTERRYVDEVRLRGNTVRLDGGYQVLEFDGIPVVEDVDCPAGNMVFLNTRHVFMGQMNDQANEINQSRMLARLQGTEEEQFGAGGAGVSARLNHLAKTGDKEKFQLITYPQICVKRPNATGVIADLS